MAGKSGYQAAQRMRTRPRDRRGGNERPEEDFVRDPEGLAAGVDAFLDHLRALNRTDSAIRDKWHALKYFLRWAHERDLIYPAPDHPPGARTLPPSPLAVPEGQRQTPERILPTRSPRRSENVLLLALPGARHRCQPRR